VSPKTSDTKDLDLRHCLKEHQEMKYYPKMDILKMLDELREEQKHVEETIMALERLALGHGKRRGRPPAWMKASPSSGVKRRGRPPGSKNKPKPEAPA